MPLTDAQRSALLEDGYVVAPGLVPRARVDAALAAINRSLGEEGIAKDALWTLRAQTFCPELVGAPPILDLYRDTPARELAAAAIGDGHVRPPRTGQIALRFPEGPGDPSQPPRDPYPHIDGMPGELNGVAKGTLYHFTALLGVFLSEVEGPFQGNFTVWPGTHRTLEAHFRTHGLAGLQTGFPPIALPPARQLTARRGDVILAHHQLAHGAAKNLGPHIRYAVFFRLSHQDHDPGSTATMTDLWREWSGVKR